LRIDPLSSPAWERGERRRRMEDGGGWRRMEEVEVLGYGSGRRKEGNEGMMEEDGGMEGME
jgi:hypothetical protein